jgi:hypothetical protein
MPRINFTSAWLRFCLLTALMTRAVPIFPPVPDSSPVISYLPDAAWGDSDTMTQYYANGTFHFTNVSARPLSCLPSANTH